MQFSQKTFANGLDLLSADTQIQDGQYRWLINGRQRYGTVEPNKKAIKMDNAPAGKKQGGIGVGDVSIIFVAGKAYYRRDNDIVWIKIANFLMDPLAELFYTATVPSSTFNFVRKVDTSFNSPMLITADFNVSGTPAGVLVQDGSNQPWIITLDQATQTFLARETKKYADWQNTSGVANDREYVPIGTHMMFMNQILFVYEPIKKQVLRSVSGRPLDFMVNVDADGNKLPTEAQGGASSVSFAFDSDDVTNLTPTNVQNTFIYATNRNTRLITFDYTNTIFGEPTFIESGIIVAGIVNHQSVQEILGDYIFIDFEGIKSFNAVQQLKFEGRNSNFSLQMSRLFRRGGKTIKQTAPVSIGFDNYSLFDVDTTWGRAIMVYDNLINKWVSIDIIAFTGTIKQFWTVETTLETKLFCITHNDEAWQLYADRSHREVAEFHIRAVEIEETKVQHKGQYVHVMIQLGTLTGTMRCIERVDEQLSESQTRPIDSGLSGVSYPVIPPVMPGTNKQTTTLAFPNVKGKQGRKIAYILTWDSDAQVQEIEVLTSEHNPNATPPQANKQVTKTYGG